MKIFLVIGIVVVSAIPWVYILNQHKEPKPDVITINQAGLIKLNGKVILPDSVKEAHYNYKGQLFEPSVKYYSIQK